jgi:hypothetical protein
MSALAQKRGERKKELMIEETQITMDFKNNGPLSRKFYLHVRGFS